MQEENENVLEKYGRDITEAVRLNKVDPVIESKINNLFEEQELRLVRKKD